jgi:hypothetical protein
MSPAYPPRHLDDGDHPSNTRAEAAATPWAGDDRALVVRTGFGELGHRLGVA